MDAPELPKDQEHTPAEPGAGDSTDESKPKRRRGPLSPEARRRKTAKQAVARELERVLTEGTTEEIEALKRRLSSGEGDDAEAPAPPAEMAAPPPSAAAVPGVPPPPPGWPSHEATARARPLAELVVGTVSTCVGLMGVDLAAPRNLAAGTPPMNLQAMLTDATAPVLALYSPDFLNTPLGNLAATLAMVATVVASELAMKRIEAQTSGARALSDLGAGAPSPVASA